MANIKQAPSGDQRKRKYSVLSLSQIIFPFLIYFKHYSLLMKAAHAFSNRDDNRKKRAEMIANTVKSGKAAGDLFWMIDQALRYRRYGVFLLLYFIAGTLILFYPSLYFNKSLKVEYISDAVQEISISSSPKDASVKPIAILYVGLLESNIYALKADAFVSKVVSNYKHNSKFKSRFIFSAEIWVAYMIVFMMLGHRNKLIPLTVRFREALNQDGVLQEDDSRLVLATPVGYLLDTTGIDAAGIAKRTELWKRLDVDVDEKVFDTYPKKKTINWFRIRQELDKEYIL